MNVHTIFSQLTPLTDLTRNHTFNVAEQRRISSLLLKMIKGEKQETEIGKTISNLLRYFFWNATAFDNKGRNSPYELQPYWSQSAILQYLEQKLQNFDKRRTGLRHEHSIPIKILKEKLWQNPNNIEQLITKFSIAIVLTKKENSLLNKKYHDKLPDSFNWDKPNVLNRYIEAGIGPIYDIYESAELTNLIQSNKKEFEQLKNKSFANNFAKKKRGE